MSDSRATGGIVASTATPSRSVTTLADQIVRAQRVARDQAVQLDLVIDRLQRAEDGLSRAEVVDLQASLDAVATRLSEVAGSI